MLKKKIIIFALGAGGAVALAFILSEVFSGRFILSQGFTAGPLAIRFYGLTMATAVLAGCVLAIKRSSRYGVLPHQAEDILFWTAVGGFIGARLYHVFSSLSYYLQHPLNALEIWHGGLSIFGAVMGGVAALFIYLRLKFINIRLLSLLDWLAPSVILGQIIGRFGNFFNYEAYGYPSSHGLAMYVPLSFRTPGFESYNFFQPLFLYEAVANLIILMILLRFARASSASSKAGRVFFLYLFLYNSVRFFLEFQRTDSTFLLGGLRLNVLTSAFLAVASALWLLTTLHVQKT